MPECTQISSMLSDYLDRDLPPDTCAAIDAHLQSCSACTTAAESLRRAVSLCRQYRAVDQPGPLAAEKHQELRAAFENALRSRSSETQGST